MADNASKSKEQAMDRNELIEQFTREQRIEIRFPDVTVETAGAVLRSFSEQHKSGFILYSQLDELNVERAITEQVAYFEERGFDFEWKVFDYDRPEDLKERLKAHGFQIEEPEALMVLPLKEGARLLTQPVPAEIRRVTRPEEIDALMELEHAVWGNDHSDLGNELKTLLRDRPDYLSVYAAYADGRSVSAAWCNLHPGSAFASLWGGTTLPEYRKRGFYSGLLAARAQEAWRRGYRFLYVDASPMSRPILERHAFQFLGFSYPCLYEIKKPESGPS